MNQNHYTSLELAIRMKELGFPQDSEFVLVDFYNKACCCSDKDCKCHKTGKDYHTNRFQDIYHRYSEELEEMKEKKFIDIIETCSAYSVAELGEMLPIGIECGDDKARQVTELKMMHGYWIAYEAIGDRNGHFRVPINAIAEEHQANSRARMLIFLAEKGLTNPNNKGE